MPSLRLVRLLLLISWLALPFSAGPALAAALAGVDPPVRTVAAAGLWTGWAVGLPWVLAPRPIGLTLLRVMAPAAVGAAGVAALAADVGTGAAAAALAGAGTAALVAFLPEVGELAAAGAAYPNESRHLLRTPAPLVLGPLPLAWALVVAGLASGPLLLADRRWVAGGVATAVGVPVAVVLLRALHGLSQRWVVFVPAGLVLHDPLTLADPVLFRRHEVVRVGPAPAATTALDLTARALGLALQLDLRADAHLVLARPGRRAGEPRTTRAVLFTPTRPGRVLAQAAARHLPVG